MPRLKLEKNKEKRIEGKRPMQSKLNRKRRRISTKRELAKNEREERVLNEINKFDGHGLTIDKLAAIKQRVPFMNTCEAI
jgi:hypothetical protein